jgi:hypothetical protein
MSRSTADVTVGLDNRLKRYSAVAIAVATLPVAGVTHAGFMDGSSVTSKRFTVESDSGADSHVVSWLWVDLEHDLASTGKGEFNGANVLLMTFSDYIDDGAPQQGLDTTTAFGFVTVADVFTVEGKVVVDAGEFDDKAARFPDEASVNFDNLKDDKGKTAGLFEQGFDDGSVFEEGNFLPGSGPGLLAFDMDPPIGPDTLGIQVNEDSTITAFGVTPVPEPTTWALMALGVAGMAGVRRATRKPAR